MRGGGGRGIHVLIEPLVGGGGFAELALGYILQRKKKA